MKLLFISDENDPGIKSKLEKIAQRVLPSAPPPLMLRRGLASRTKQTIDQRILDQGNFHLIVHHCGSANFEYQNFVRAYRDWREKEDQVNPIFILFTGGTEIENARREYLGDERIEVVEPPPLLRNFAAFLEGFKKVVEQEKSTVPFYIFRDTKVTRLSLPLLHALLPFGTEFWLARNLKKNIGSRKTEFPDWLEKSSGLELLIGHRFAQFLCVTANVFQDLPSHEDELEALDFMIKTIFLEPKLIKAWKLSARSAPVSLEEVLKLMAASNSLEVWNSRLNSLANALNGYEKREYEKN